MNSEPAHAYELQPARWPDNCFTHDGTPALVAAIDEWAAISGIRNCGFSATPRFRYQVVDALPDPTTTGGADCPSHGTPLVYESCTFLIRRDAVGDPKVILHEVGHGLGLGHSNVKGAIMYYSATYSTGLTPDDITGARSIYGPPLQQVRQMTPRATVGVARD